MGVYVDIFIFQNFVFNALAIFFATKISSAKSSVLRIIIASLFGAIYALLIIVTNLRLALLMPVKLLMAVLMIRIATPTKNLPKYLQSLVAFFIIVAIISGFITFVHPQYTKDLVVNDYFVLSNYSLVTLLVLILLLVFLKWVYENYMTFKDWYNSTSILINVIVNNNSLKLNTVLDTGNNLSSMFTKVPVIVVNRDTFKEQGANDLYYIAKKMTEYIELNDEELVIWTKYGKLIPYHTVGSKTQLLPAFKPDSITLNYQNKIFKNSKALIALAPNNFFNNHEIQGLMHPVIYKSIINELREG